MADNVIWRPQPGPQHSLVTCEYIPEIFFGGARGGGKTDGVLGKWALKERRYGENFVGMMFRRTATAAKDTIVRSKKLFEPLGGDFVGGNEMMWRMPNGGRIYFSYLRTIDDADNFQGWGLTDAWTDEGGQYPDPAPIDRLFGALRSAVGVPVQMIITANPGGVGQSWISKRYKLIPLPQKPKIVTRDLPDGTIHKMAVIPSRITDNKILLDSDPGYVSRLHLTGSASLVKAWLEGDWNAVEGAYFDCWSQSMVIKPFPIPSHWTRFRSFDWGTASPFSVGWWAVSDGTIEGIPPGALVRYREWYGAQPDKPNKGLKMTNRGMAKGILARESDKEKIDYSVADPSIFADKGGPTIAEEFASEGVFFIPGDNARLNGWSQMRQRMTGNATEGDANGHMTEIGTQGCQNTSPMVFCFSTCVDSIRTIPALPHSLRNPEDLDTDAEDHIADEWRYGLMSRPWMTNEPTPAQKGDRYDKLFKRRKGSKSWR